MEFIYLSHQLLDSKYANETLYNEDYREITLIILRIFNFDYK